jgi:tripartite-type tricarboxylate transporter receptor subunit TctC
MRRFLFIVMVLTGTFIGNATVSIVRANDWPQRVVRIITSFPVGTGGDISARLFAEKLASRWGKPVVVENRPGADGIIAVTAFTSARDENTLLFINGGPVTTNPFNNDRLPYDPVTDLVPISSAADAFIAISVPASLNVDSLAGFVTLARTQPRKFNWGATPGALDYLVPGFLKNAGLDMTHVAYRDIGPALQDLSEARIHLYVSALATQMPLIRAGKVKVLAITNKERTSLVPEAPTVAEAGFPDLSFDGFLGFFGPKGMQSDLRDRIGADLGVIGADPAIISRLATSGLIVRTNTSVEFSEIIARERTKISEIVRTIGRKPASQ